MSLCNFTQPSIKLLDGGIVYEVTPSSSTVTVNCCYGNYTTTDHPLSMTYQFPKWPVICQINGKML